MQVELCGRRDDTVSERRRRHWEGAQDHQAEGAQHRIKKGGCLFELATYPTRGDRTNNDVAY